MELSLDAAALEVATEASYENSRRNREWLPHWNHASRDTQDRFREATRLAVRTYIDAMPPARWILGTDYATTDQPTPLVYAMLSNPLMYATQDDLEIKEIVEVQDSVIITTRKKESE